MIRHSKMLFKNASAPPGPPGTLVVPADMCLQYDDSSVIVDSAATPNTITDGGVTYDTTTLKYGSGSGQFGSGVYQLVDPASWMNFGAGDFTISLWFYSTYSGYYSMFLDNPGFRMYYYGGYLTALGGYHACSFSDYEWTHLAVVRSSLMQTVYINGVATGPAIYNTENVTINSGYYLFVGTAYNFSQSWYGNFDDIYIKNGVAIWTSDFSSSLPGMYVP